MKYYAGLDVSLKEISIYAVDAEGQVSARGDVDCDPGAVLAFFTEKDIAPKRIVHESG